MKVWDSLRRIFGAKNEAPPTLRNKPGGMAWVQLGPDRWGAQQLDGRAVRCVRIETGDWWVIDPPLALQLRTYALTKDGLLCMPGEVADVASIRDKYLVPWKDIGDVRDESLFLGAPRPEILALPVREMTP